MLYMNSMEPHRVGGVVAIRSSITEEHADLIN